MRPVAITCRLLAVYHAFGRPCPRGAERLIPKISGVVLLMLQSIRDRASGWIAYLIIFLIAVPFALWGIHNYFEGGGSRAVAKINGVEIPPDIVRNQLLQQKARLREVFGGQWPEGLVSEAALKEAALQQVINQEVLRQAVATDGFQVSDANVMQALLGIEAFQVDGRFDVQRYERLLASQRKSKAQFEGQLRNSLRLQQLVVGIEESSFLPAAVAADYQRLRQQTRELTVLRISAQSFAADIELTSDAIDAYYQAHQNEFMQPERVKLEYVELSMSDIAATVSVVEDELRELYRQQIDRYRTPEERRFRQILIKVAANADANAWQTALTEAEVVQARIDNGESFTALAKEYSAEVFSGEDSDIIGPVAKGDLAPSIDRALFDLAARDEVSMPIRTGAGYRLLQLVSIEPAQEKTFAEVRDQVEEEFRQREAERRYIDLTDRLLTTSFEVADSLRPTAAAVGLPVQTTDWVTRQSGAGIGQFPVVRETAFAPEVIGEGLNSDLIELPDDRALVLRVKVHEPARPQPLDQVRAAVTEALTLDRVHERATAMAESIMQRLASGETPAQLADDTVAELIRPDEPIARDSDALPRPVVTKAFQLPNPVAADRPSTSVDLPGGDVGVVVLTEVHEPDIDPVNVQAERVERDVTRRELDAFEAALAAEADVEVYRRNLSFFANE